MFRTHQVLLGLTTCFYVWIKHDLLSHPHRPFPSGHIYICVCACVSDVYLIHLDNLEEEKNNATSSITKCNYS